MGHSEMLLAVAGLKPEEIRERTRRLATGAWTDFSPAEALVFAFAHQLTREPSTLADQDIKKLTETFGTPRAVDLIWYTAWCNYMTRVADAFQFPLEQTNVFARPQEKDLGKIPPPGGEPLPLGERGTEISVEY